VISGSDPEVGPVDFWDDRRDMSSTPPPFATPPATPPAPPPAAPPGAVAGPVGAHPGHSAPVPEPVPLGGRKATRDTRSPVVGGVASGVARHLGLPVLWVRAAFVLLTFLGGSGIVLYAALWLMLPADSHFEAAAPGIESATRGGRRPGRVRRLTDVGPAIALGALGLGAVLMLEALLGRGVVFWPLVVGAAGVGLLWRQADEAQRERWLDGAGRIDPVRVVLGNGGWASYARLAGGLALVVVALVLYAVRGGSLSMARDVVTAALLAVAGLALVVGPWVWRLASDLTEERTERVRTQERADVAAHLHDSVLQTLALIQRNADDPAAVSKLARGQERDLRSWLYSGESTDASTVAGALRAVAARVEDEYAVTVEVVTVGDCPFDEHLRPLVQAAGEAVTNAAKHAGTGLVDVYAEVLERTVEVFVRDRGPGFDPAAVPDDRYGVRASIVGRMERHGGSAEVRSTIGEGTEVRLRLDRTATEAAAAATTEEDA
jgi:signal transduction histidine kinase/phage shock protein PspC (stress-responsive transcriptional regulator)